MIKYSVYVNKFMAASALAMTLLVSTVNASQDVSDQKKVVTRANFAGVLEFVPENAAAVVPLKLIDKNLFKQMVRSWDYETQKSFALTCKAARNLVHGGNILTFKYIPYRKPQADEAALLDIIRCRNSCVEVNLKHATSLTPKVVDSLIAYHPDVFVLKAEGVDLEASSVISIARGMKSLKLFECGGFNIDDNTLTEIGKNLTNLEQLGLGSSSTLSCLMTDAGVQALTQGCTGIKNLNLLKHVRGITSQSLVNIANLPLLETLAIDVSDRGITTDDHEENITPEMMEANTAALTLLSKRCTNLRNLTLGGGAFTNDAVLALAANCPLLEKGSFLGCVSLTGEPFHELVSKCTQLNQIFFYGFYPLQRASVRTGIEIEESDTLKGLRKKTGGVELKIIANMC